MRSATAGTVTGSNFETLLARELRAGQSQLSDGLRLTYTGVDSVDINSRGGDDHLALRVIQTAGYPGETIRGAPRCQARDPRLKGAATLLVEEQIPKTGADKSKERLRQIHKMRQISQLYPIAPGQAPPGPPSEPRQIKYMGRWITAHSFQTGATSTHRQSLWPCRSVSGASPILAPHGLSRKRDACNHQHGARLR